MTTRKINIQYKFIIGFICIGMVAFFAGTIYGTDVTARMCREEIHRAFYPLSTDGDKKFTSIEINEAWIEILDYIAALVKGNHKNNIPFPTHAVQIMQKGLEELGVKRQGQKEE